MKINLKYFLLGMILALGPVFIWAEIKLGTSYKILGEGLKTNETVNSEYLIYDYFEPNNVLTYSSINEDLSSKEPTITPEPTETLRPVVQVAAQERLRPTVVPTVTPANIQPVSLEPSGYDALIEKYAADYGADPNLMKKIAKCESGYNPESISPSGAYHGMYQFVASTWISNRQAMGLDPNPDLRRNAEEAIKTAAFKMGRDGYGAWPHCSRI